ncbi:ATP-binding protein [Caminicella sporogenes]|uniref:ATP-binding protein n=1 Tax=Caminicella sporogenes TaxID=166485 RepID=UPI0025420DD4|nr:ATP-binding protein [Caminicella sporogenes]WIF94136.1 ATP-binding protein [Caminicella sporogenes]
MKDKYRVKKILIVAVTTALMGQVYLNPFNSDFRLSIGIAILTFLLIKFDDISIILTTLCTSISVFIFRFFIDVFQLTCLTSAEITNIFLKHFPSAIFYIAFGIALFELHIRDYKKRPVFFIFLVGISDIVSNILEAAVRQEFTKTSIEIILTSLFIAGFTRATISLVLFSGAKAYNMLILKEEHEMRYRSLLLLTANMKAELFLLRKTMKDIEQAMEKSYLIYTELKKANEDVDKDYFEKLKRRILNLTKDIHEIKKDNQRVLLGIERLLPNAEKNNSIRLSTIFKILYDNTIRVIRSLGKNIYVFIDYSDDFMIYEYYPLITILNNLINNSIDAIKGEGFIKIIQKVEEDYVLFQLIDNGEGINEKDIDVIFEPGFSTKFDIKTGRMSTGLGLAHVKHILENHYKGKIKVESEKGKGTRFFIYIPKNNLIKEGDKS